jgi:hypothetical protein
LLMGSVHDGGNGWVLAWPMMQLLLIWGGSFCYSVFYPLSMQPNGQCHSGWLTVEFCEVIAYLCHQWWNYCEKQPYFWGQCLICQFGFDFAHSYLVSFIFSYDEDVLFECDVVVSTPKQ